MPTHIVRRGDCWLSLAAQYGVTVDDLRSQNADLSGRRPDDGVLAPGDAVIVPARRERAHSVSRGATNRFTANVPQTNIRLVLQAADGQPLANMDYELDTPGHTVSGTSDGNGVVTARIAARADLATITIFPDANDRNVAVSWPLRIGGVDPLDEPSGAAGRLRNLGFLGERATPAAVRTATARFQASAGLEPNGDLDDATRAALGRHHDEAQR